MAVLSAKAVVPRFLQVWVPYDCRFGMKVKVRRSGVLGINLKSITKNQEHIQFDKTYVK